MGIRVDGGLNRVETAEVQHMCDVQWPRRPEETEMGGAWPV